MPGTPSRKREHVELCIGEDVRFRGKTNGFEEWEFEHCALPELHFRDIDTSTDFLGKRLSFPFLITGMTGGYAGAEAINRALAETAEEEGVALGVGSMRQALESDAHLASFAVARKAAPTIPILANLGAAEVAKMRDASAAQRLVDLVEADALAVHLNPLQEFLQPEGNPSFAGVLDGIARLVAELGVPVVVKEVGAGISAGVATRLHESGVRCIDVAGAGGTSWAGVELLRRTGGHEPSPAFWDWGIRTADALDAISGLALPGLRLIASGGISDGVMIAKSLAMGASLAGAARPLLLRLDRDGRDGLRASLRSWKNDLQGVMFLTGAKSIEALRATPIHRVTRSTSE
ncbi:MAG: type 2 isopentenyl-diphosphate Delta-isomerase [Ignavibacteria bacterium]|nr:type 2 isopentenyl-diphosphate Delta-isomerase [Ignavibacteria bacterium]